MRTDALSTLSILEMLLFFTLVMQKPVLSDRLHCWVLEQFLSWPPMLHKVSLLLVDILNSRARDTSTVRSTLDIIDSLQAITVHCFIAKIELYRTYVVD